MSSVLEKLRILEREVIAHGGAYCLEKEEIQYIFRAFKVMREMVIDEVESRYEDSGLGSANCREEAIKDSDEEFEGRMNSKEAK